MKSEMKLVDILARHLQEWPKENPSIIAQDDDGNVYGWTRSPERGDRQWLCGIANLAGFVFGSVDKIELSSDHKEANVTRSQWQAAVDALKAGEQQAWRGEGLPPVGTVCEAQMEGDWVRVQIMYLSQNTALLRFFTDHDDCEGAYSPKDCKFRPIRTAEQIAEQEHREAVEALAAATDWILTREACEAVLAAGYRKQESKQ